MDKQQKRVTLFLFIILLVFCAVSIYLIHDLKIKSVKCALNPVQYLFDSYGTYNNVTCFCADVKDALLRSDLFQIPKINNLTSVYSP